MKISILCTVFSDLYREVKQDPTLNKILKTAHLELDWPSREFDMLKTIWPQKPYASARLEFSVSDELFANTRFFEVWRSETAYSLSNSDMTYLHQQETVGALLNGSNVHTKYFPPVRYFPEVRLTNAKTKERQISSLDTPDPIYFIDQNEAEAWRAENFSGLKFGPVYRHRGQQLHSGVSLIVPENVMGPMEMASHVSSPHFVFRDLKFECLSVAGFVVYTREELSRGKDFNFTCEPIRSYGNPALIVSKKFVDFYRKRSLKGWIFRPVLEFGSTFQAEFMDTFDRFMADWNTGSPESRIDGS